MELAVAGPRFAEPGLLDPGLAGPGVLGPRVLCLKQGLCSYAVRFLIWSVKENWFSTPNAMIRPWQTELAMSTGKFWRCSSAAVSQLRPIQAER